MNKIAMLLFMLLSTVATASEPEKALVKLDDIGDEDFWDSSSVNSNISFQDFMEMLLKSIKATGVPLNADSEKTVTFEGRYQPFWFWVNPFKMSPLQMGALDIAFQNLNIINNIPVYNSKTTAHFLMGLSSSVRLFNLSIKSDDVTGTVAAYMIGVPCYFKTPDGVGRCREQVRSVQKSKMGSIDVISYADSDYPGLNQDTRETYWYRMTFGERISLQGYVKTKDAKWKNTFSY